MTAAEIEIEKHETGAGWFKVTIRSLKNFVGQTKIEMLLREETLREFRGEIDRALSENPKPKSIQALMKED